MTNVTPIPVTCEATSWRPEWRLVRPDRADAGDVRGQEVDAVSVEVAAGAVVVLGGAGVGVAGKDLGVAQRDTSIEGVGDRRVPQGVRADVPWDAGGLGDAGDHAVNVASVDRLSGQRPQDQWPAA